MKTIRLITIFSICLFFASIDLLGKSAFGMSEKDSLAVSQKILESLDRYYNISIDAVNTKAKEALRYIPQAKLSNVATRLRLYHYMVYNYEVLGRSDSLLYFFQYGNQLLEKYPVVIAQVPITAIKFLNHEQLFYSTIQYNHTKAMYYLEKAMYICQKYQIKDIEIILKNNLANIYDKQGQYQKAFELYQQIDLRKIPQPQSIQGVNILTSITWNAIRRKSFKEALQANQRSIDWYKTLPENNPHVIENEEAMLFFDRGICYSNLHDITQSEVYLNKVIAYFQENHITKGKYLSLTYLQKSENLTWQNQPYRALQLLQQGLNAIVLNFNQIDFAKNPTLSDKIYDKKVLFDLLSRKAQLLTQLYQQHDNRVSLEQVVKTFALAIALAEKHRKSLAYYTDKIDFSSQNIAVFNQAIAMGYLWYKQAPSIVRANVVIRILESIKAIALIDKIGNDNLDMSPQSLKINDKLIVENQKAASFRQKLSNNIIQSKTRDSLENLLNDSELKAIQLTSQLYQHIKPYPMANSAGISVRELSANLPSNMAFLNYTVVANHGIYVWLLANGKFSLKYLPQNNIQLGKMVSALLIDTRKNPTIFSYKSSSQAQLLYQLLLKPFEKILNHTTRITISRDGLLNYIPFELLETGQKSDDYLLKHYAISYQYSVASYLMGFQKSPQTPEKSLLNVSPFTQTTITQQGDTLQALASSALLQYAKHDDLLGKKATKSAFLAHYRQYALIHLQCHSVADTNNFGNSYLYFHPSETEYRLGFHEIGSMPFNHCQLMMIPTCNSANGKVQRFEGVLSLGYAFYKAGCQSVLAAQWQAQDASSDFITSRFFQYLQKGQPKDVALQQAKLDFLSDSNLGNRLNHPFFWANVCLIGNTQALVTSRFSSLGWSLLVLILLGFLVYGFRKWNAKKFASESLFY